MFIRAIVVPILVICLILFIGVSYNNASDVTDRNNDRIVEQNNSEIQNFDGMGIATTPIIPNITNDNSNLDNSITETQLKNEIERINGIDEVYVRIEGNTLYVIKNGENINGSSMSTGNVSIKDEIIRTVKNISPLIDRICILDDADVYGNYKTNSSMNLSIYENSMNVIEVY